MALKLEEIRALADRVASSHGLEVVDVEYQGGGGKHRTLRVFIEKNEAERAKLRARVSRLQAERALLEAGPAEDEAQPEEARADSGHKVDGLDEAAEDETSDAEPGGGLAEEDGFAAEGGDEAGDELDDAELTHPAFDSRTAAEAQQEADAAFLDGLPSVTNLEFLSGITHEDCEAFSRDFGTVVDVEELVPGTEYLLEVSSPGLDRKLTRAVEYQRFVGSLVKLQTFEAVAGSRQWQGRIASVAGQQLVLSIAEKRQAKKGKKAAGSPPASSLEIAIGNVEKAYLVPEF